MLISRMATFSPLVQAGLSPCSRPFFNVLRHSIAPTSLRSTRLKRHACSRVFPGLLLPRQTCGNVRCQGLVSPDIIAKPFVTANSVVCIPWALMILAPNWSVTKKMFKSDWSMIVPGLVFAFFFVAAAFIEISNPSQLVDKVRFLFLEAIADPEKMKEILSSGPGYAAQDWIHLIAWDLIGGRWIYLDGLNKKVPTWHSLIITFGGGPLGLLLHFATCRISRKQQLQ